MSPSPLPAPIDAEGPFGVLTEHATRSVRTGCHINYFVAIQQRAATPYRIKSNRYNILGSKPRIQLCNSVTLDKEKR